MAGSMAKELAGQMFATGERDAANAIDAEVVIEGTGLSPDQISQRHAAAIKRKISTWLASQMDEESVLDSLTAAELRSLSAADKRLLIKTWIDGWSAHATRVIIARAKSLAE